MSFFLSFLTCFWAAFLAAAIFFLLFLESLRLCRPDDSGELLLDFEEPDDELADLDWLDPLEEELRLLFESEELLED